MKFSTTLVSSVAMMFVLFSCKKDNEPSMETLEKEALQNYAAIVSASYEDSYTTAVSLKQKIDAFVVSPTAAGLEECKTAWKAARVPYGQTEAYRFYGGPIDDENGPEGLINSWPLDENYIDYKKELPDAGLINKTDIALTKEAIESLNQMGGATEEQSEVNVATGYHAIEFLLWGEDLSTTDPGDRPYTDYVTGTGGTSKNQARRGQYLKLIAELLVDNLASVKDQWKTDGTYRTAFLNQFSTTTALTDVFTGLGELSKGELSGERMIVAATSKDQENEHSCFSDNTHIDIQMNFKGLQNVYFGKYTRVDGTVIEGRSLAEIVEKANKTKADAITAAFRDAETKIGQIPTPFDQAILNSTAKIEVAAEALSDLSDKLTDGAFDLGVRL